MIDYSPEEVIGKPFLSLCLTSRDKKRVLERIGKNDATENFETRLATKSGAGYWVNLSWNRIDDATISCTAVNINGRKIAEKLNNDNMMKYSQLTENSPMGFSLFNMIPYCFPIYPFQGSPGTVKTSLQEKIWPILWILRTRMNLLNLLLQREFSCCFCYFGCVLLCLSNNFN